SRHGPTRRPPARNSTTRPRVLSREEVHDMPRHLAPRLLALAPLGAIALGAAACGVTTAGVGAAAGTTPTVTTSAAPAQQTAIAAATRAGAPSDLVTLALDRPSYGSGDAIAVTIRNGLATTIYASDHQTDCTEVTLERSVGDTWQSQ